MQCLGGKSRTRNQIAAYLNMIRKPGQPYWEPFVGAGWVLEKVKGQPIYASDANSALIAMWQALQQGWEPPSEVSEEMFAQAKAGEYNAALTAFIMIGCAWGGKWGAGYARGKKKNGEAKNYAEGAKNSLLAKYYRLSKTHFFVADFLTCYVPAYSCLIYCDPPYKDTAAYGAVLPFDHSQFWERVRWLEDQSHTVVVSEYQAPDDFSCVMEITTKTNLNTNNGKDYRIERLFRLDDHPIMQPSFFSIGALNGDAEPAPQQATLFEDKCKDSI